MLSETSKTSLAFDRERSMKGLTEKELSEKAGVSQTTVHNFLNCRTGTSFENVIKIGKALGFKWSFSK